MMGRTQAHTGTEILSTWIQTFILLCMYRWDENGLGWVYTEPELLIRHGSRPKSRPSFS